MFTFLRILCYIEDIPKFMNIFLLITYLFQKVLNADTRKSMSITIDSQG